MAASPENLARRRTRATGSPDHRLAVAFVMEQHLGHRTYFENLRAQVDLDRYDPAWIPVHYEVDERLARLPLPGSLKAAFSARREVRRGLSRVDADVHVFNTQVPAVLGGRAARSKPFIAITDVTPKLYDLMGDGYGHQPDGNGPVAKLKDHLNRRMFNAATWCVGWSQWVCDSIVADYGVDPERTRVISPGVDTAVWHPAPERDDETFRILFVGGDFERKGGQALLEAFASLEGDTELVLVTRSEIPRHDRVRVVSDLVPNDERLIELYRSSDVFALPSRAETFGIAAAEAAASGLPVVVSDVGGFADIVENKVSGFTLPVADASALTRALRDLRDPELRKRMGAAARQRAVERLDASTNAQRLLDLVDAAAGRATG